MLRRLKNIGRIIQRYGSDALADKHFIALICAAIFFLIVTVTISATLYSITRNDSQPETSPKSGKTFEANKAAPVTPELSPTSSQPAKPTEKPAEMTQNQTTSMSQPTPAASQKASVSASGGNIQAQASAKGADISVNIQSTGSPQNSVNISINGNSVVSTDR